jgi:anti-sigma B factor antagonist
VTAVETLRFAVASGPGDTLIVTAHGVIGLAAAAQLEAVLRGHARHGRPRIVVDLGDVRLIDSAGLTGLLRAHREAIQRGGWVRLARPRSRARRVLETMNLGRILTIHDTVRQATDAR